MERHLFSNLFVKKVSEKELNMGMFTNLFIECGWIYSMSKDWKAMDNSIRSHLFVMLEHLVKVYYYHNYTQYVRGWADSIKKGFEDIGKVSLGIELLLG